MDLNWDLILQDDDTCVCCQTDEQRRVLLEADKKGLTWNGGDKYTDRDFVNSESLCFYMRQGKYGSLHSAETYNKLILYFKDILIDKKPTIKKIKVKYLGEI